MSHNPDGFRSRLKRNASAGKKLVDHNPAMYESYWETHDLSMKAGALDQRTKELVALALVVVMICDVCITFHVRACLKAKASREEIYDVLNVAVMQGDGSALVHANYAVEALDEYLAGRSEHSPRPEPHGH